MRFDFEPVPRHWAGGSPVATHLGNSLNLLFPLGERFFVRAVKHYFSDGTITDPELRAQVKGFFGQEGRHAHEHERFFEILESQGYEIRPFLRRYNKIAYGFLEPLFSRKMALSVTVALEHYTALMAESAFENRTLDAAHPRMRELLMWHAAEEIEHKAVAFDVLQQVDDRYSLRVAGLVLATLGLLAFWTAGTAMLVRQERPRLGWREFLRQYREARKKNPVGRRVFARGIREYLRRDFHPWDNDNLDLAHEYLASVEPAAA